MHKAIPALSSKKRPRDKPNAIENIDQSTNSFRLLWRELHNIDVHSSRRRNCKIYVYLLYVSRLH